MMWLFVAVTLVVIVFILASCAGALAETDSAGEAPDYSRASCWYQIPEITREVNTFFVYPTEYLASDEGDPDYAALDNPVTLDGVQNIDHRQLASI